MTDLQESTGYATLGLQLGLSMAFFVGGGYLLDRWLGTDPWLLVGGAVLGAVAFFVQIFRVLGDLNRDSTARRIEKEKNEEAKKQ